MDRDKRGRAEQRRNITENPLITFNTINEMPR
jgi:hypothetical protein